MKIVAGTVADYIEAVLVERRAVMEKLRKTCLAILKGYLLVKAAFAILNQKKLILR